MVGFSLILIRPGHWSLWMASASLSGSRPGWVSGGVGEMHEVWGADRHALSVSPIVTPKILRAMLERQSEFTNFKPVRVAMGTWNVNGGKQFRSNLLGTAELADWLLDAPSLCRVTGPPGECSRVRVTGVDPPRRGPRPQVGSWVFGLLAP